MVIIEHNGSSPADQTPEKPALTAREKRVKLSAAEDQLAAVLVSLARQETRLLLVFSRWAALHVKRQRLLRKIRQIKDVALRPSRRGQ